MLVPAPRTTWNTLTSSARPRTRLSRNKQTATRAATKTPHRYDTQKRHVCTRKHWDIYVRSAGGFGCWFRAATGGRLEYCVWGGWWCCGWFSEQMCRVCAVKALKRLHACVCFKRTRNFASRFFLRECVMRACIVVFSPAHTGSWFATWHYMQNYA